MIWPSQTGSIYNIKFSWAILDESNPFQMALEYRITADFIITTSFEWPIESMSHTQTYRIYMNDVWNIIIHVH